MNDTIAIEIEGTTYTLRRRLGWYDQGKINEREFKMYVNGKDLARVDENLENLEEIEIRMTTTDRDLSRLQARLVGLSTSKIKDIPPAHIPILLEKISELEQETDAEVRELREGNPTATRSDD